MEHHDKHSFYMEGTNGKGVLLVHGLTGVPAEMKLVARQLNRKGYTVYAPLLAGHGVDTKTLVQTRWQDWLASVQTGIERLMPRVNEMSAAGICVGGKLAMLAAHSMPNSLRATAIYSPCFNYDGWNVPAYYRLSRHFNWLLRFPPLNRKSFSETESMGIKDERLREIMKNISADGVIEDFPAKGLVEMHSLGKNLKKLLPSLHTPTLILHATEDDLSNPRHARYISKHIAAPHELHWIEDSYHMIHIDRKHRDVANLTAEFFSRHAHA